MTDRLPIGTDCILQADYKSDYKFPAVKSPVGVFEVCKKFRSVGGRKHH